MAYRSVSVAMAGSGGAGLITAGTALIEAAGRAGWYGCLGRSVGAQIRGGETVALCRIGVDPVETQDDRYHVLLAVDWNNLEKFSAEMPLGPGGLIITDPDEGEPPAAFLAMGATIAQLPLKALAKTVPGGRANMIALGAVAELIGVPAAAVDEAIRKTIADKHLDSSLAAAAAGAKAAAGLPRAAVLEPARSPERPRWNLTGNQAASLGAVRGGVRFVAAYPITPATEILETIAPMLAKTGGVLIQAEDELSCVNQLLGASFGGQPALTATSGPGLALMMESLGLAVASETPIVVVDVMRGGPSTGIPAKTEQSDLNIAIYGQHGDAPHLVLAPNSTADCLTTTQWAVGLAEKLQTAALVLSDQALGQTRAILDRPPEIDFCLKRETVDQAPAEGGYRRYLVTDSGVSPMAVPGTPDCQYTADGLEHTAAGLPSSQPVDHKAQMDKRLRKLTGFDYGERWADVEGEGDVAILTWGSCTGAAREARARLADQGVAVRLISLRLISPLQKEALAKALAGVSRLLVVELSHSAQFHRYLRAETDLAVDGREVRVLNRPGPLPMRPNEILEEVMSWI